MAWKDLAPWIAIAVTLILSILVPLFTQIANNHHQIKMMREKEQADIRNNKIKRKREAYEEFLLHVGAAVSRANQEKINDATASLSKLYAYAPQSWWPYLDALFSLLREYKWDEAEKELIQIAKFIAEDLNNE